MCVRLVWLQYIYPANQSSHAHNNNTSVKKLKNGETLLKIRRFLTTIMQVYMLIFMYFYMLQLHYNSYFLPKNQYLMVALIVADWLTLENRRLWEERLCKICGDGETAVLFDPCGHMCACQFCSAVQRHCPMCGQFVQNHHRVFRS